MKKIYSSSNRIPSLKEDIVVEKINNELYQIRIPYFFDKKDEKSTYVCIYQKINNKWEIVSKHSSQLE